MYYIIPVITLNGNTTSNVFQLPSGCTDFSAVANAATGSYKLQYSIDGVVWANANQVDVSPNTSIGSANKALLNPELSFRFLFTAAQGSQRTSFLYAACVT
jgi:hypothetical protein